MLNVEEGSEPSFGDGDGRSETTLTDAGMGPTGVEGRDPAAESFFEYGSRVGFWRLFRLFKQRAIPITISGSALALERNPPAAAAIRGAGDEVLCHGWRWVSQFNLSEDEEREHIRRATSTPVAGGARRMISSRGPRTASMFCTGRAPPNRR